MRRAIDRLAISIVWTSIKRKSPRKTGALESRKRLDGDGSYRSAVPVRDK
jgi:hypothetical protein